MLKRAPNALVATLRTVDGVADVQTTLEQIVRVQIPGSPDPIIGQVIGIDRRNPQRMNRVTVASGRAPDVVVTGTFAAIMVGSGDREKPLLATNQDHFFQILDRNLGKGAPVSSTPIVFGDLAAAGTVSNTDGPGCYVPLDRGEKVVNASTSIGGNSHFGTNRPSSASASGSSCSANLGIAKAYAMPLFCVSPTGTTLTGGGLPPSPVSGIVTVGSGDSARKVAFIIGAPNPKNSGIEGSRVNPLI